MKLSRNRKKVPETRRVSRQTDIRPRADVFSYRSSRSRPESSKDRSEPETRTNNPDGKNGSKTTNRWQYAPSIAAVVVIFISIMYSTLLSTTNPQVVPLSDTTPSLLRPSEEYQTGIADILSNSPLTRSKITIQTDKLEQEIMRAFPELSEVSINIPLLGKRPIVQISPAQPKLVLRSQNGDYVLDSRGVVLMLISDLQNKNEFKLITVNDSVVPSNAIGERVLPESTIEFINSVAFQFEQKGQVIEAIDLPAVANELHVRVQGSPYYIKFNLQNDPLQQAGSYFALSEKLAGGSQPSEYIDLRVAGRAYYK